MVIDAPKKLERVFNPIGSRRKEDLWHHELRYNESYRFFAKMLAQTQKVYFPVDRPVKVNHPGIFKDRSDLRGQEDARPYLINAGAPHLAINEVFDELGLLREVKEDGINIWGFDSPPHAAGYVAGKMHAVNQLVQASVDYSLPPFGFNRHERQHQHDAQQEAQILLGLTAPHRKDITLEVMVNTAIAGEIHDDGISLSRGDHSLLSLIFLKHFIPGIDRNPRFTRVALSIIAHDPPRLRQLIEYLNDLEPATSQYPSRNLTADRMSMLMEKYLPPEALALIAADRNQYNRKRVPKGILSPKAFTEDKNILPEILWNSTPQIEGNTYIMHMLFTPAIEPAEQLDLWAGRPTDIASYHGRQMVNLPNQYEVNLTKGISYSQTAEREWATHFRKDIEIQAAAIMALNPFLTEFVLYIDASSDHTGSEVRSARFRREHLQEDIDSYFTQLTQYDTHSKI